MALITRNNRHDLRAWCVANQTPPWKAGIFRPYHLWWWRDAWWWINYPRWKRRFLKRIANS